MVFCVLFFFIFFVLTAGSLLFFSVSRVYKARSKTGCVETKSLKSRKLLT